MGTLTVNKQQLSLLGKRLFIIGLVIFALGSPFGWIFVWVNFDFFVQRNPFLIPGIGFGIILLSLVLMSLGSRVGDDREANGTSVLKCRLVSKRVISTLGKLIFIAGFLVLVFGSMIGALWTQAMFAGFGLILLSFVLLALGSRVGDERV